MKWKCVVCKYTYVADCANFNSYGADQDTYFPVCFLSKDYDIVDRPCFQVWLDKLEQKFGVLSEETWVEEAKKLREEAMKETSWKRNENCTGGWREADCFHLATSKRRTALSTLGKLPPCISCCAKYDPVPWQEWACVVCKEGADLKAVEEGFYPWCGWEDKAPYYYPIHRDGCSRTYRERLGKPDSQRLRQEALAGLHRKTTPTKLPEPEIVPIQPPNNGSVEWWEKYGDKCDIVGCNKPAYKYYGHTTTKFCDEDLREYHKMYGIHDRHAMNKTRQIKEAPSDTARVSYLLKLRQEKERNKITCESYRLTGEEE